MNRGMLNGYAINGSASDPVVRVRVDAKGYARVRARGRVLAYAVVATRPSAVLDGKLGRVEANLSGNALARAAIEGALGRVDVHGLLAATGRAVITVTLPPVRNRVVSKARASIGLTAHAEVRAGAAATGRAKFTPKTRRIRRSPVKSKPAAQGRANGTVYVRRWLRSPVDSRAQMYIVTAGHVEARLALLLQAVADGQAGFHVDARAPLTVNGTAFIEIDPSIHKRLPFDEPAPESRTFRVPEAMTTFYVTDQGTAMFRVSPPMQPADTQDFDIEFDGWFPPGDEIVSVALKAEPPMPMPPSYAFVAQRVKVWVYAGGTSGLKYKITVTATTNDGRVKEVELIAPIKEV